MKRLPTSLSSELDTAELAQRRGALRQLLQAPLTLRAELEAAGQSHIFLAIVRHADWLAGWFQDKAGWTLIVDARDGFARLHKTPAADDPAAIAGDRAARADTTARPFDRRRYVLTCLVLAALENATAQTTLSNLAALVREISEDEPGVASFDPDALPERRAFVDALRWLLAVGVLAQRDGDTERYVARADADVLYDVDDRILAQMIATPLPPALAGTPAAMLHAPYAATDEGRRLAVRHRVARRLFDDPVVYYDDLTQAERDWLERSRGAVASWLETDLGLAVELRREGIAAIDPDGELTDERFPDGGSTVKHVALLLIEQLAGARRARDATSTFVPEEQCVSLVTALIADYAEQCSWRSEYLSGPEGAAALARDAFDLLAAMSLVRPAAHAGVMGWELRPAAARFRPART